MSYVYSIFLLEMVERMLLPFQTSYAILCEDYSSSVDFYL